VRKAKRERYRADLQERRRLSTKETVEQRQAREKRIAKRRAREEKEYQDAKEKREAQLSELVDLLVGNIREIPRLIGLIKGLRLGSELVVALSERQAQMEAERPPAAAA
jgi:hypothetical protein